MKNAKLNIMGFLLAVLVIACTAQAQGNPNTWTGAAGDRRWETGGNWTAGVAPGPPPNNTFDVTIPVVNLGGNPAGTGLVYLTDGLAKPMNSLTIDASPTGVMPTALVGFDPATNMEMPLSITATLNITIGIGSSIRGGTAGMNAGNVGRPGANVTLTSTSGVVTIAGGPGGRAAEVRGGTGGGTALNHSAGRGGDVSITAPTINMDGHVFGGTAGRGDTGNISLQRGGDVSITTETGTLTNRGVIMGGTGWRGRGGNVTVNAATFRNFHFPQKTSPTSIAGGKGFRNTAAGDGPGGDVNITALNIVNFGGFATTFWPSRILGGEGTRGSGALAPGRGGHVIIYCSNLTNGRGVGPTGQKGEIEGGRSGMVTAGPNNASPGGDVTIRALCSLTPGAVIRGGTGATGSMRGAVRLLDVRRLLAAQGDKIFGGIVRVVMANLCDGAGLDDDQILFDLRGVGAGTIEADDSICITIDEEGILDLRENSAGTHVLRVIDPNGWINISMSEENLLTDKGVAMEQLTAPATDPSPPGPPCDEVEPFCPSDLDGNGTVDADDLVALLGAWGPCDQGCPADLNDDGFVNVLDLLILLGAWGACPN